MLLSPLGGIELDMEGVRKRRWFWWDMGGEHVHAPPFQPLMFTLNNYINLKVASQDKIQINFLAENQICKFRVGSKFKVTE